MLKDKRDDFDENEDADLTGMIHQYNEDNELRRKINEMKKQKAENKNNEAIDVEDDNVFIPSSIKKDKEDSILDIRADQDAEKTRVGFQDDGDKTLVIMDRKNKIEPDATQTREDLPGEEENEKLREDVRVRKEKQKKDDDDEEISEKDKKINKRITYVIIAILCVALLVGVGFGVKAIFFNGDSNKESEVEKEKESETTKKKKPKKETNIEDNTATINQLKDQRSTYEEQLAGIERDIASAQKTQSDKQASINAWTSEMSKLSEEEKSLNAKITAIQTATGVNSLDALKEKMNTACSADAQSNDCTTLKSNYANYNDYSSKYALNQQEHEAKTANVNTALNDIEVAKNNEASLKTQKTDLEAKIANITTKLSKYE